MRVHVIGNACNDTVFRVSRLPLPGETINAGDYSESIGGKGANQAVAAARTGADVTLWTALGRDLRGNAIAAALGREVRLRSTQFDLASDQSTVIVDADGQNAIVSAVACIAAYRPVEEARLAGELSASDLVLLQGNMASAETDACLRLALSKGSRTFVNASPIADNGRAVDLRLAGLVIVNRVEAEALTGHADPNAALRELASRSGGAVIITLGPDGCVLTQKRDATPCHLPAPCVAAIDTSGAGDVFCGSLVGFMAQGVDLITAARLATEAAAIAVTRTGTLASCPTNEEMRELAKSLELA